MMQQIVIDKRYKILKKLGSGSMGDVYKVSDLKDKRIIGLKILSIKKTSTLAVQRFKREFRLLAGLHHPNLCSVFDFGMLKDGRSYFTMEYIDGKNIYRISKGLPYNEIYPWIVQFCRVLEYIHSKGLIHYDIKPGNVLIAKGMEQREESKKPYAQSPVPCVKLMDFGLAGEQMIKGGFLMKGTFPYIAPEVIRGLAVDHRADLYSLGVLLHEIFSRRSFKVEDKDSFTTLIKQRMDLVSKPVSKIVSDIPKGLEQLILRLLSIEPSERYSRANEIIKEINRFTHLRFPLETEKTLKAYLLSSRFVGRDREMGLLKSLYERAEQGKSRVVIITGDAGIGKSRLLKEFKIFTQLRRSHCFMGYANKDRIVPLEPFHNIFSELVKYMGYSAGQSQLKELKLSLAILFKVFPDLTNYHIRRDLPRLIPLEPKQEKLRIFEALTKLVNHSASGLGELVILLEDLHWADELSIEFLEYLGRNLEDRNILICGTCRREELKDNLVLKRMITNLRNEGYLNQIELKPLRFRSLYTFLDSTITRRSNSSGLVRYLLEKTGGNPFFVEEIMRAMLSKRGVSIGKRVEIEQFKQVTIPEAVEGVVLERLRGLDRHSRKVVRFACILVKEFSYDLIKYLTQLEDTELSRALWKLRRRQILIEENNRYRFYHATLRETANEQLSHQKRKEFNYRVGTVLENTNKRRLDRVVEDLAYYFINARNCKKGIKYGLSAAKKSSKRYANEQAIEFYKGVLGFLGNKNLKRRFDVLQRLAKIEAHVGYYDEAIKHYNKALSLKTETIDQKIRIYLGIGIIYEFRGEHNKASYTYRKGNGLLKRMKPCSLKHLLETEINVKMCRSYLMAGDYKNANKFNLNALKSLKGLKGKEPVRLQGSIYNAMGGIEFYKAEYGEGNYDKAISYYQKAYKYYNMIKAEDRIVAVLNNLGTTHYMKFDFQKAFDCHQKAIQISEKIGNQYGVSMQLCNLANILRDKGCYSEALGYFQKAHSISKKIGNPSITCGSLSGLGGCFFGLFNYKKAEECYKQALKILDPIDDKRRKSYLIQKLSYVYQALGEYSLALKYSRKALKVFRNMGNQYYVAGLFIDISSIFTEISEFSRAERYVENALKIASAIRVKELESECYIVLCHIKTINKDYSPAKYYYEKGITISEELGAKRELIHFSLLLSEIYYCEKRYSKGIKISKKAIKLAKELNSKDLYLKALLINTKNKIEQRILSKTEVIKILNKAKVIAEEIGSPEILWKVYYEYGRNLQDDKEYHKALEYYQKCIEIFKNVSSKIKNESYRKGYLNHPDRKTVFDAIDRIEKLIKFS